MASPTKANGSSTPTSSPAMLLLDRKAVKKQMINGGPSSSQSSSLRKSGKASTPTPAKASPAYTPQQLLNPRSSGVTSGPVRSKGTPLSSTMEEVGSDSDGQKRKREKDDFSGNMLENLYGVENRAEHPQKLVRVVKDEENGDQPKLPGSSTSFNVEGHGAIGKFMKETNTDPDGPKSSVVDLTSLEDPDDDVVITGRKDIGDEVVCYGTAKASIHAHRMPRPRASSAFDSPTTWPLIICNIVRDPARGMVIKITGPDHNEFGKLDPAISAALAPVMDADWPGFRTAVRIPIRKRNPGDPMPGHPCSEIIDVSITIYGPRRNAEGIGKHFARQNIWFEKPLAVDKGITVFNPHADQRRLLAPLGRTSSPSAFADNRTVEEATREVSKLFDSMTSSNRTLPVMEPSGMIMTPLLDHQKQALWFMVRREKPRVFSKKNEENTSLWREDVLPNGAKIYKEIITGIQVKHEPPQVLGGLLADMMGLGKTIEILALIATTMPHAVHFSNSQLVRSSSEDGQYLRNAKTTLLISPLSAVKNWEDQIREHVKQGGLTFYVYHGSGRTKNAFELANYDIVIATYGTVSAEARQNSSPLQQLRWFRVVLDEAHTIREQRTVQAQVIYSLWATRRWAVTGTPIQNRLDDLGSLVKFLRLYPYNETGKFAQYIKSPIMSGNAQFLKALRVFVDSFTLRRLKEQLDLPQRDSLDVRLDFSPEEMELHDFFRRESHAKMQIVTQKGLKGSMHFMLTSITTLRLVSAHGRDLLNSKDRAKLRGATKTEPIDLDDGLQQQQMSTSLAYEMLEMMVNAGFNLCMQCKEQQIANEPSGSDDEETPGFMFSCFDIICPACFAEHKEKFDQCEDDELSCPLCSTFISKEYLEVNWEGLETARATKEVGEPQQKQPKRYKYSGPHTKTKALLADLSKIQVLSRPLEARGEPPIKSVVFSEFTSHLDLLGRALSDYDHKFLRIDGSMGLSARRKALDQFASDDNITVLLASTKAAGQGLNLTAASRAFIMEPMWNPAAEQQAVDRVHRLGQTRDVVITRYLMNDSIEVRIREMQEKKQKMAEISLNRDHKAYSKQAMRDETVKMMRDLFSKG